jgi:polysaccharide pyruvyl transferase WcaK-like protein
MTVSNSSAAAKRPARVGLLWHSVNSENLGVTALTASNIAIVEQAAKELGRDVEFVVLGWTDPGPEQFTRDNLTVYRMRGKDLLKPGGLYAQARRCDLVLDISAGDSFADIYGAKRFALNAAAKCAVRLAGTPLILSPQTIGPFERPWARGLARAFMKGAAAVVTRDSMSTAYASSLGVTGIIEATDVAFRLPYEPAPKLAGPVRVGINISGLLFHGGYTQNNMFALKADYPVLARQLITRFLAEPGCEIHLVSHVISDQFETEDDYRVALALSKEFPGVIVAPRFATPSEAKSYISGFDFFCGSRMHACIAAFSSGVPVVPMAYSRKFSGLFGSLGYNEVTDCKTQTADEIIAQVMHGYHSRGELKQKVEVGRQAALAKLEVYSDILKSRLKTIPI